jgi:hypothetical protein
VSGLSASRSWSRAFHNGERVLPYVFMMFRNSLRVFLLSACVGEPPAPTQPRPLDAGSTDASLVDAGADASEPIDPPLDGCTFLSTLDFNTLKSLPTSPGWRIESRPTAQDACALKADGLVCSLPADAMAGSYAVAATDAPTLDANKFLSVRLRFTVTEHSDREVVIAQFGAFQGRAETQVRLEKKNGKASIFLSDGNGTGRTTLKEFDLSRAHTVRMLIGREHALAWLDGADLGTVKHTPKDAKFNPILQVGPFANADNPMKIAKVIASRLTLDECTTGV